MAYDKEHNTATCKAIAEEIEEVGVYKYFEDNDVFNIEYRIDTQGNYRSVEVMVACGGPNIYIDTGDKEVQLYWWTDEASYLICVRFAALYFVLCISCFN